MVVQTRSSAKKPPRLNANTPALRNAQAILKHRAILTLELAEIETQLKNIRRDVALTEAKLADSAFTYDGIKGFRKKNKLLRRGIEWVDAAGEKCGPTWRIITDELEAYEQFDGIRINVERIVERVERQLRVVQTRRKCALSCVQVLRVVLSEVRDRQQAAGGIQGKGKGPA